MLLRGAKLDRLVALIYRKHTVMEPTPACRKEFYGATRFRGSPQRKASMLVLTSTSSRWRASRADQAVWGVTMRLSNSDAARMIG